MENFSIEFKLTDGDIASAVKADGKTHLPVRIVQTVLLLFVALTYFTAYLGEPTYTQGLVVPVFCIAVASAVWLVPYFQNKSGLKAALAADREEMWFEFSPLGFAVSVNGNEKTDYEWRYTKVKAKDEMLLIYPSRAKLYPIPFKYFEKDKLAELQEFLKK